LKEDVSVIYADNNSELILDSIVAFGSNNISLISKGYNTTYICDYECHRKECTKFILKISLSDSFRIMRGILKYGIYNTSSSSSTSTLLSSYPPSFSSVSSFYFADICDNGYLLLNNVRLIFVGKMKSMINIRGGSVCIEYMRIINEEWVEPLIEVYGNVSSIIVEIYKSYVIGSNYTSYGDNETGGYIYKSGIVFINKLSNKEINLNISNCLFNKNIFILYYNENGCGNVCYFSSLCKSSSMVNILFINLLILIFLLYHILF
jgi:hypothetical protein